MPGKSSFTETSPVRAGSDRSFQKPRFTGTLAGVEVHVTDLDVRELVEAHSRIKEQFEQDLVLHIPAVLDGSEEAFKFRFGE